MHVPDHRPHQQPGARSQEPRGRASCRASPSWCVVAFLAAMPYAGGQVPGPVQTYPVNEGVNGVRDSDFGEFGPDLGGTIPWERYKAATHPFQLPWTATTYPPYATFADFFAEAAVDKDFLDSVTSGLGFAGYYNNFHPIKGPDGVTVKLLVQSPGYLMLFDVNHQAVASELLP